jgi:rod shape determining protein RodA
MMVKAQPRPFAERVAPSLRERLLAMDWMLLLAALGLTGLSIFAIDHATRDDVAGAPHFFGVRHAVHALLGLLLALAISRFDYSRLREFRVGLYAAMLGSIVAVLLTGAATRGARSWFDLGIFQFQPSEVGKVLLILVLAGFLIERNARSQDLQRTARMLMLGLGPATLVLLQPDLGTAMVYVAITVVMLFIAGVPWSHLALIGAAGTAVTTLVLVAMPAVGLEVLKPYQVDRLTAFLHPSSDPGDAGYQVNQSLIAIGSGQKAGRGEQATQSRLDFLPERHTDFIFAVVGERYGFVGAAMILSLYALLIWRGLRILTLSKNFYGALIAGGLLAMLMFQVFVNVGMTLGLAPITGIPLPLMSYGGTSVLVTFLAIGLLQSIYVQARLTAKGREPVL